MPKIVSMLAAVAALAAPLSSIAQTNPAGLQKATPPPSPFVNKAPDFSEWVIHVKPAGKADDESKQNANNKHGKGSKEGEKALVEVDVTKTRDIQREVSQWTDGSTSEIWLYKGLELYKNSDPLYISVVDPGKSNARAASAKVDFSGFTWLSKQTFGGVATKNNCKCYYFRYEAPKVPSQPENGPVQAIRTDFEMLPGLHEAWINADTCMPVADSDEQVERTYEFKAPPTQMLSLPPGFKDALDRYTNGLHYMDRYRMAPPQ